MSWEASGYVKSLSVSSTGKEITRGEKLVLLILADYHNPETGYANPSINRLADEGLYERRQILRIVESLEEKSFITIERSDAQTNNKYRFVGLVTKCHQRKRLDKIASDIDSDILPSKMSPEPILANKPIESPSLFLEQEPSNLKEFVSSKDYKKPCADSRHAPVRAVIIGNYQRANGGDMPAWNGREAKKLSLFLDDHKDWPVEKIIQCVNNRFHSEENHAEDPRSWIEKLAKYAAGPLDKFGKPLGAQNGQSKQAIKIERNREAIRQGLRASLRDREDAGQDGTVLQLGNHSGSD